MERFKHKIWSTDKVGIARLLFSAFAFLFVFDIPFNFLPYNTGVFMAMLGWGWFVGRIFLGSKISFDKGALSILLLLLILSVYSYAFTFAKGTHDTHVPRALILFFIIVFPAASFIANALIKLEYSIDDVLYLLVKLFVLQACIIYVMFLFPDVKQAIFGMMRDGEGREALNLQSAGVRSLGLSYGTTWDLSILQSLGLIFISLIIRHHKNLLLLAIFYVLLLGSIFVSGRTGLFGVLISIVLLLFQLTALKKKPFRSIFKFYSYLFLSILLGSSIIYSMLSSEMRTVVDEFLIPFAFELFISKSEGGQFETASSNELKEMYFPVTGATMVWGDGYYDDPTDPTLYYMETDAGYMRHVLYYGLFGSVQLYLFYIILFSFTAYGFTKYFGPMYGLSIVAIGLYFFIAHVKGDMLMGGNMPLRVFFLLFFYFLSTKSKNHHA